MSTKTSEVWIYENHHKADIDIRLAAPGKAPPRGIMGHPSVITVGDTPVFRFPSATPVKGGDGEAAEPGVVELTKGQKEAIASVPGATNFLMDLIRSNTIKSSMRHGAAGDF